MRTCAKCGGVTFLPDIVVPSIEELWHLVALPSRDAWARAHQARIIELPEDVEMRGRWLPAKVQRP